MSPLVSATHVEVIEKDAQKFLSEMDAKTIAKKLHVLNLIPQVVQNCILQPTTSNEDANVELLTFIKAQAGDGQIEKIFECASQQKDRTRMKEFADDILQKLRQGLY